jgi:TPR repeat protein
MPSFALTEALPVIGKIIQSRTTAAEGFVEHESIVKALMGDKEGRELIAKAAQSSKLKDDQKIAANMVAWFSQRITMNRSDWSEMFERRKTPHGYAYRRKHDDHGPRNGTESPNNAPDALETELAALVEAAGAGNAEAARELGDRFRQGEGVNASNSQALHWYSVGAKLGDASAQNNLASMLFQGVGCDPDVKLAVRWWRASAKQGNPIAQFNLGLRYFVGQGVKQDDRTAGEWIAAAAGNDYVPAVGMLGTLFRFGKGTEPDLLQAAQLHISAAMQGDAQSLENLTQYCGTLENLALKGNREAAFDLCLIYNHGLGVKKDPALCWAWVRCAREECEPMSDEDARTDELNEEVAKAHSFFKLVTNADTRAHGESLISEMRQKGLPSRSRDAKVS